ncbi:beta-glucosidase 6 [Phlyctema vagabunda]|uniref:glucan 1,3-beta-glucosidase n=1 Tax=Phlyctema vagabunda TaxID=108571 RepID=A0ABR4PQ36_9HELO
MTWRMCSVCRWDRPTRPCEMLACHLLSLWSIVIRSWAGDQACISYVAANPLIRPVEKRGLAFDYNGDKVRGVNLGGWFVLEPWITPSIFEPYKNSGVVDEYTLTQFLGRDAAQALLESHWNSFITEADFQEIASFGLNHVRIPVGYWALNPLSGDPYVQGQLPVLDRAIGWARNAGLKVMLDLHGAPASQNGFDNSGRYGAVNWQSGDTVASTVTAIRNLAARYAGQSDVVTAIELLNEPAGFSPNINMGTTKQFYYDGWGTIRDYNADTAVVIHDAFLDIQSEWNGFMNSQAGVNNVILDTHIYNIFSDGENALKPCQHVQAACANGAKLAGTDKWTIVGEWTGAQTDCAKWLNGLGKGARYDGTFPGSTYHGDCQTKYQGSVDGLLEVDKVNLAYYVEAQLDAYEAHSGWIFWTWITESAPEWNFRDLTRAGLIPQPLTSRKFGSQCSTTACSIPGN